ncbi:MAG TPA: nickel pincer cofactor biosynthesis protein LarC [Armatimonadota bacterium]|nr:nickel pincer cofactor biosynthesis protein LarC [Armatimonadota bacterium]
MKIAYFDCFAGISGDMTLGALIDAGADVEKLQDALSGLHLHGYKIEVKSVEKSHIMATDVNVEVDDHHHHHHRGLTHIREIIQQSGLSGWVKDTAIRIFTRLAEAEAKVHGSTPDEVHFHEVGAVDAIVDIVGTAICLELLDRPKVVASPLPTFHGFATGAHGTFPLPAPATVELLQGVPLRRFDVEGELVTPTGAAIITTIASEFGSMPSMSINKVGHGSGKKEREFPNLLRVILGEGVGDYPSSGRIVVIETNIDDFNPQFYDSVMERLFSAGALDVYLSPIQMKKNRPGTLLSVLCPFDKAHEFSEIVLKETSTLGVRITEWDRICLDRRWQEVETDYGRIRIKIGELGGKIINASPEYEDCKKAADAHNVPVKLVYDAAVAAYSDIM